MTLAFGLCPIPAFATDGKGESKVEQSEQKPADEGADAKASAAADKNAESGTDGGVSAAAEKDVVPAADSEVQDQNAQKEDETASPRVTPEVDETSEESSSADAEALSAVDTDGSDEESAAIERNLSTLDILDSSETAPIKIERPEGVGMAASSQPPEGEASTMAIEDEPAFVTLDQKTTTIDGVTYTYVNTTDAWGTGIYIIDASWSYRMKIPGKIDGVDVVGFQAQPSLETNQMYHLDASGAPTLQYISTMDLMTIDVSNNAKLRTLICSSGSISELDVSKCIALESLNCSYNRLSKLDTSRNPNLTVLNCENNFLTHLDLSKNPKIRKGSANSISGLYCAYNLLDNAKDLVKKYGSSRDTGYLADTVNGATILPQCYATGSGLVYRVERYWNAGPENTNVKVVGYVGSSKNVTIPKTLPVRYDSKQTWNIKVSQVDLVFGRTGTRAIESLDASAAIELVRLWCPGWDIRKLSLPKSSAKLVDFDCEQNNLGSLDLTGLPNLEWLYCAGNNLATLDVSKNPKLINLSCGIETNHILGDEVLRGNDLVELDLSANPNIEYLLCDGNGISSVDVSKCKRLLNFNCSDNSIDGLNIAGNPRLEMLYCQDNLLAKLDASANKQLKRFRCYNNYIADTKALTDRFGTADRVVLPQYKETPPSRLAGDTALDTMASITKQGFDSSDTVIIATMGGYWDALAASSLAGVYNCPILLTDGSSLSSQTASEIKRLKASKVYITGGTAAVSAKVEASLKKISGVKTVKRLAGDIAINTALKIYEEGKGSWGTTAVVATSETFQDALSVSPYGFAKRSPIFLANASTHKLDPQVLSAIKAGGFDRIVIVGGTAALSDQLESQQLKGFRCVRLAGPTAYETSGAIAAWCIDEGMTASNVGVATGSSYYDALAGAAFCGKNNSALVLVSDDYRSNIDGFIKANKATVKHAFVFGGPAAVSPKTYNAITTALR